MLSAFLRKSLFSLMSFLMLAFFSHQILLRNQLSDDAPFRLFGYLQQYARYVSDLLHGQFGVSHYTNEPLFEQVLRVLPATISLCLIALILALVIGIPLGFFAQTQSKNLLGKIFYALGFISFAMPTFWLALVLLHYATVNHWALSSIGELNPLFQVKNITGFRLIDALLSDSPWRLEIIQNTLYHLALPALILAFPTGLEMMRLTRERVAFVYQQNYTKVAQIRGWSRFKVWRYIILRNSLPPLIPSIARNFSYILAFGMLIENIFSWPGIGRWLISALAVQDYSVISIGLMAIGSLILAVDFIAFMLTLLLDPAGKKEWFL